ncbi:MAG: hypothetical protein JSW54_11320 [Fidelibacterota bacterium]|nr:MAG: hypothetical protein JSW54_11320 [Candidatus Neomarinimicrobiota bacterium]
MKTWTKAEFETYIKQMEARRALSKALANADRKFNLHEGNKIRTLFYNYGSIGRPNTEPSMEWPAFSNLGYAYEFGPLVGAEVVDNQGDTVFIFSDGMLDGGDTDATGGSNVWGWEPLPGYAADGQENVAMSNDPVTWGDNFPTNSDGDLIWPGQFGDGVITADVESYYVMDDRFNAEFSYYPVPTDSSIRGLGLEVEARGYQYAASVAEDILFFQFTITNVGEKRLDKVVVGMIGDPHIGGAGDFADDYAGFIDNSGEGDLDVNGDPTGEVQDVRNLVYCWDKQGSSNDGGIPWEDLGWLGYKFLESPSVEDDGVDNDGDGRTDESRSNGIDDDGDWHSTDEDAAADTAEARNWFDPQMWDGVDQDGDGRIDDWGDLDGKSDDLNGNGVPDPGEPDFDVTDLDESDMIGLTSFWAPVYATEEAWQDDKMWQRMTPGAFAGPLDIQQGQDNIFIFGSGYFSLEPGESQNFSIAIIMGLGKEDLFSNARVADWIYNLGFNFSKPPEKPNLVAIPGDKKATLYWDDVAEASIDPVNGKDFEGYKIYRSTVKGEWGKPITDNQGVPISYTPIAIFDLIDEIEGPHTLPSAEGYHMDMGDETGLIHSYVDTNLFNGLTYYYAVTAYDFGSIEGNLPPLECSRTFGEPNVVSVVPNAPAAGFEQAAANVDHYQGYSTATFKVTLLDPTDTDDTSYEVRIDESGSVKYVSVYQVDGTDATQVIPDISLGDLKTHMFSTLQFGIYKVYILDQIQIEVDSTRWSDGVEYFEMDIEQAPTGIPYPRDIELRFFADFADTSVLVSPQPIKVQAWNINENTQLDIVYFDRDGDNELSIGDEIRPVVYIPAAKGTWSFTIADSSDQPPEGTTFNLWVSKPFVSFGLADYYRISATPASIDASTVQDQMADIAVVPNPYVATSGMETPPPQVFTYGRGERRVDFIHLPQVCTIRIFTMAGEHVQTLEHSEPIFDGTESWNLLNKDGHDIAPGIYIYHVETPDGHERIGRLAIIK